MDKKNAGMQAHEEIMAAIKEIHEREKEVEEIKARLSESLEKKETAEFRFISSALSHYQDGRTQKSIHVFCGIEKLAEVLGAEDRLKTVPFGTDGGSRLYDIQKEFEKDGVKYYQIETSEERKEELTKEMTE